MDSATSNANSWFDKTHIVDHKYFFQKILSKLIERNDLTADESEAALDAILTNKIEPVAIGAFLCLLRAKGETPTEIAGLVKSVYRACYKVKIENTPLLDIVGTGGDGANTINISTASAVLASACGCKIAKAGNRSVSSNCGSADVLEMLGVEIVMRPQDVSKCIQECGLGFLFAPVNHPAMKIVAPVRNALKVRTVFNILGPLTNAASAQHVVIGVFDEKFLDLMANALIEIGSVNHGVIIHSCGLDELSPLGPATIVEIKCTGEVKGVKQYSFQRYLFDPLSLGIQRCCIDDLRGGGPQDNARALKEVLEGGENMDPKRDAVILNAGMGLYVYGIEGSIADGVNTARRVLQSGAAAKKLQEWIMTSKQLKNLECAEGLSPTTKLP